MWVATNSLQIKVIDKVGFDVNICSIILKENDRIVCFIFVNNTDILEGNLISNNTIINNIVESIQDAIDL